MNHKHMYQKFNLTDCMKDEVCGNFVSWCRFITHSDEITHLYFARNERINEVKRRRAQGKTFNSDSESSEGLDLEDVFKGHNVRYYNVAAEVAMWKLVKETIKEMYEKFPTTLEQD